MAAPEDRVTGCVTSLAIIPKATGWVHGGLTRTAKTRMKTYMDVDTFLELPAANAPMSPIRSRITHTLRAWDLATLVVVAEHRVAHDMVCLVLLPEATWGDSCLPGK
ncbi:hypothetical protein U9M48_005314 [Paspalum notatum var. saurae]|uniref:Uncharacterized protein n=1 Tax=Paspalum notatum var. saurae TaxID=547442 RepID=A0AAQ3PXD7_PASNO